MKLTIVLTLLSMYSLSITAILLLPLFIVVAYSLSIGKIVKPPDTYFCYEVTNTTSINLATLTSIKLGRWLATEGSRGLLKSNGYPSDHSVFIVAEGHTNIKSVKRGG